MFKYSEVIIENQTKFNLEYVTHNYASGWPQEDVKKSFVLQGEHDYVLPPGAVGTQLWRFHQGGNFYKTTSYLFTLGAVGTHATESYFSVRIREETAYIVSFNDMLISIITNSR